MANACAQQSIFKCKITYSSEVFRYLLLGFASVHDEYIVTDRANGYLLFEPLSFYLFPQSFISFVWHVALKAPLIQCQFDVLASLASM